MNCPYCNKEIEAMTGLQELQKFTNHLQYCKKNPKRKTVVYDGGAIATVVTPTGMKEALQIRHDSGQ